MSLPPPLRCDAGECGEDAAAGDADRADEPLPPDGQPGDSPSAGDVQTDPCDVEEDADTRADAADMAHAGATSTAGGLICNSDVDWWKFSVAKEHRIRFEISSEDNTAALLAVDFYECDSGEQLSLCELSASDGHLGCLFDATANIDVCLQLSSTNVPQASPASYNIMVESHSSTECAIDVSEPHDSMAWPYDLGEEPVIMEEVRLCPNDRDWYRVASTESFVSVTIEMDGGIDSPNAELAYYGETDRHAMALCRSLSSSSMQCSFLFGTPAGTYGVGLSTTGTPASGAPYTLAFDHEVLCGDLGEETNNGPPRATAWVEAEADKHYGLCKIDVDWFSYPAVNDDSLTNLELTLSWYDPEAGSSDITCSLFQEKDGTVDPTSVGGCVGSKTNLGDGWSQIVASNTLTPGVVHYVAVLPAQSFDDQYDIEFTLDIQPR